MLTTDVLGEPEGAWTGLNQCPDVQRKQTNRGRTLVSCKTEEAVSAAKSERAVGILKLD